MANKLVFDEKYNTRILLLRHGESLGNAIRAYLGHTDLDLSPLGYEQARQTAEYFKEYKLDKIYSSPLIRAQNTARAHAELRNMPIEICEGVKEIYLGKWEGLTHDKLIEDWEEEFTQGWKESFGTFTPPAGEPIVALGERVFAALTDIAEKNVGRTVLVATHAAAIRSFWGRLSKIPQQELASAVKFPSNCSVSVVYYDGSRLVAGEYSFCEHLNGNKYFDA